MKPYRRALYCFAPLILCALSSCGSGIHEVVEPLDYTPVTGFSDIRIIGNSITYHPPSPDLGWFGDWGMAASNINNDYAHLSAASLGLPLLRLGIGNLESAPPNSADIIASVSSGITPTSAVVVELGDNVSSVARFKVVYDQLLTAVGNGKTLTCTSTFWLNTSVDDVIQATCKQHHGQYVFIGYIFLNPLNPDYSPRTFSNPFVEKHPHDWSMARIAVRVDDSIRHPS